MPDTHLKLGSLIAQAKKKWFPFGVRITRSVSAEQNQKETKTMKLIGAMDLHSNNVYTGIITLEGKRVFDKRLPNRIDVILSALEPYRKDLTVIAVESTYNWYWLVDGLE